MAARQDELRRLMKESKGKTQSAEKMRAKGASTALGKAGGSSTSTGATAATAPQTNGSAATAAKQATIPAGFFDDSLADAKARNVDIKQLAETQLEQDWEQFQDFVAEVEQQDVKDSELQQQETKEKEAVEQLENMQYVDRYRIALERATQLAATGTKMNKRAASTAVAGDNDSEPVAALQGDTDAANDDGEELSVAAAVQSLMKKRKMTKKAKKQKASSEDDSDDETFDPCNWRSKAF